MTSPITARMNNSITEREQCAFCGSLGACASSLIFMAPEYGYVCVRCAIRHAPDLVADIVAALVDVTDLALLNDAIEHDFGRLPDLDLDLAREECKCVTVIPHSVASHSSGSDPWSAVPAPF